MCHDAGMKTKKLGLIILGLAGPAFMGRTVAIISPKANAPQDVERMLNEMLAGERSPDLKLFKQTGVQGMELLLKALTRHDSTFEGAYA